MPSSFVSCGVKKENVFITKLENPDKEDMVTDFMVEMGQMKERQEDLDNKLENMRSEKVGTFMLLIISRLQLVLLYTHL